MTLLSEIYNNLLFFIYLSWKTEVIWAILPLFIATIVMLIYFEKFKEERPGWNTYVANSLVLLFVSLNLLRFIFNIGNNGINNFVEFPSKTIASGSLLLVGIIILSLNFKHFLPEKIASYLSSPITINLLAYVVILYVYSDINPEDKLFLSPPSQNPFAIFFSLLIIFVLLIFILNFIKISLNKLFLHLKKMKEKEKVEVVIKSKKDVEIEKKVVHKEAKKLMEKKKEVKKKEVEVKKALIKEFDKQKKEAIKLKKVAKK